MYILIDLLRKVRNRLIGEISTEQLIKLGLQVGENFKREREVVIDYSHCWLIKIGNNVTLARRVHILAHDASTKSFLGYTKIGNVIIGDNVFIGAGSIVLPNVKIGNNVIIGAGSIVSKDIPENCVAVGNPAKVIMSLEQFLEKNKKQMEMGILFDESYTLKNKLTMKMKREMFEQLLDKRGYIV